MVVMQEGYTALMLATSMGSHDCVSVLVSNGANVNMADSVSCLLCIASVGF